eukprot:7155977-Prymnesium_polylepis.2
MESGRLRRRPHAAKAGPPSVESGSMERAKEAGAGRSGGAGFGVASKSRYPAEEAAAFVA